MTGRWPPGSVSPNSTVASAVPLVWPGYQASTTADTDESHGIGTGAPALTTTTVCGFAAATAWISSFCADGRSSHGRSVASDSVSSDTTTTAAYADFAAADGGTDVWGEFRGVAQSTCDDSPLMLSV